MKSYLLDTHTLLWALSESDKISERAQKILINDNDNLLVVSYISLWEIAIKNSISKLPLSVLLDDIIRATEDIVIVFINLSKEAIIKANLLPFHHRDPFDRMLIAQAITNNLPIISADTKFDLYNEIERIW